MRPEHLPQGDPCFQCGLKAASHRMRLKSSRMIFVGIDGEGQSYWNEGQIRHKIDCKDCDCPGCEVKQHKYTLLAAIDEHGREIGNAGITPGYVENSGRRLTTRQCLDFIMSIPSAHTKIFSYSFGYDLAKILEDLDDRTLFHLFRPELRKGDLGPKPVFWPANKPEYSINVLQTRFTLKKKIGEHRSLLDHRGRPKIIWSKPQTVHDIWRFFQSKFTSAIEDWKVGNPELWERMKAMKDKRSSFDLETPEKVRGYCFEECQCMGQLARKLTNAHNKAGLQLRNYFGAGSSADAMLRVMGIREYMKSARETNPVPEELDEPIACAFFGGRFENSVIGAIPGRVYTYDISSAYPYQLCFLPCLLHGKWKHTTVESDVTNTRTALVRYKLNDPFDFNAGINEIFKEQGESSRLPAQRRAKYFGPFPFRLDNGSIVYPRESGGGWVWQDEYREGARLFPNVQFLEAWVYHQNCDCKPFKKIPEYYLQRLLIGKEGPGIVIKLGINSCYGKTAQSLGGIGAYTSWIWAGLITSGCRAQALQALGLHVNPANLLYIATDGIGTLEKLKMPTPRDTGTFDAINDKGKFANKPLGGWEEDIKEDGLFLARPGIYFPLNPTKDKIKQVRGRGVGRGIVLEHWKKIVEAQERGDETVFVKNLSRFIGAKTAITRSGEAPNYKYRRSPNYGKWITRPVKMSFSPLPKREGIFDGNRLGLRSFPDFTSVPYERGLLSDEAIELKLAEMEAMEQPDGGDLSDYELG